MMRVSVYLSLGTLRFNNVMETRLSKKTIRFNKQNNNFAWASRRFVHSFAVFA